MSFDRTDKETNSILIGYLPVQFCQGSAWFFLENKNLQLFKAKLKRIWKKILKFNLQLQDELKRKPQKLNIIIFLKKFVHRKENFKWKIILKKIFRIICPEINILFIKPVHNSLSWFPQRFNRSCRTQRFFSFYSFLNYSLVDFLYISGIKLQSLIIPQWISCISPALNFNS